MSPVDAVNARPRLGHAFLTAFYVAPWVWLVCFAIFTAAVTLAVGHFPSYSNPDPKHVDGLEPLHMLTVLLLLPLLLSPLVVGAYAGSLLWRGLPVPLPRMAAYLLGVTLAVVILFGNAFGLGSWFFD
jgi:hypothetical protein